MSTLTSSATNSRITSIPAVSVLSGSIQGLTTTRTITYANAITTLTGTTLPTNLACQKYGIVGNLDEGVGVGPLNDTTWNQVLFCCQGKPVIVFPGGGCTGWCEPSTTFEDLKQCYIDSDGSLKAGITLMASEDENPVSSSVASASYRCGTIFDGAVTASCSSTGAAANPTGVQGTSAATTVGGVQSASTSQGSAPGLTVIHTVAKLDVVMILFVGVSFLAGTLL